jgi:hypothetical protein
MAVIALAAAFLVPIGTSSLRGLTHLLTCRDRTEVPFTLIRPEDGPPVIVSSRTVTRGEPEGVCGGLVLDMGVAPAAGGRVQLRLPITNRTDFDWKGTVRLRLGSATVPIEIGEIRHGQTRVATVNVHARRGQTEVHGSLLIGP